MSDLNEISLNDTSNSAKDFSMHTVKTSQNQDKQNQAIASLQDQVEQVTTEMGNNIEKIIVRGENVDAMHDKSRTLQDTVQSTYLEIYSFKARYL